MPRKPKHPCSHPGCPALVEYGERFCEKHQKEENKRYKKYDRDPAVRRRYGRAWKRIRDSYAAAHPLCELCLAKGIYTKTEEIHHKLPLSEGGTHDRSNLIALCKPCHARIHAERGDRWHNRTSKNSNKKKSGA
ncbi:MAG: HNH endonuclease [Lachnospiraceae bacterium]|nr:HNH endonuclease [Lachnospiraceae bacterium]